MMMRRVIPRLRLRLNSKPYPRCVVKTFFSLLLMLVLFNSLPALAADHQLSGEDAAKMANILDRAGIRAIWDVTVGFQSAQNLHCSGENFVDQCEATFADCRPACSAVQIRSSDAQEFWSLLKKAGFQNQEGIGEDSGKTVIDANRIDCTLGADEVCTLH